MKRGIGSVKLTAILPWFGGKRTLAPRIVEELGEHSYYFEACAGSMAVLLAKDPAHHETVCDLHGGLTNLAWVLQRRDAAVELYDRLTLTLYGDEIYQASADWLELNAAGLAAESADDPDLDWAYHYFLVSWMGRNGVSGIKQEAFGIATRWTAGGGSGPLRFRNAVESIPPWHDRLRNVHVLRRDVFEILPKIEDAPGVAIYADPPYIDEGDAYRHNFAASEHARLAEQLRRFRKARIVVSYYNHAVLPDLYPEWTIIDCSRPKHLAAQNKRGMVRATAPEVMLINGKSRSGGSAAAAMEHDSPLFSSI